MTDLSGWSPGPHTLFLLWLFYQRMRNAKLVLLFEFCVWRFSKEFVLMIYLKCVRLFFLQWIHTVLLCAGLPSDHRPSHHMPTNHWPSNHRLSIHRPSNHRRVISSRTWTTSLSYQMTGFHTGKRKTSSLGTLTLSLKRGHMLTNSTVFYVKKIFCTAT